MNPNRTDRGARIAAPAGAGADVAESSYLITRLHHILRRALDDRLRDVGFNTAQYVIMRELGAEPALSAATLAKRAGLRPQATAPVIASLEERGFVERSPHRYNRRVREVRLTVAGRAAMAECSRRFREVEEQLLAGFGPGEREGFQLSLEACLANIDPPWYQQETAGAGHGAARHTGVPRPGRQAPLAGTRPSGEELPPARDRRPSGELPPASSPAAIGHDLLAMVLAAASDPDSPLHELSAAVAQPGAARGLMQYVDRDLARPIAARIQGDRPELRAELAAALLIGIGLLRAASGSASGSASDTRSGAAAATAPLARAPDSDVTELFDRAFRALTAGAPPTGGEPASG